MYESDRFTDDEVYAAFMDELAAQTTDEARERLIADYAVIF